MIVQHLSALLKHKNINKIDKTKINVDINALLIRKSYKKKE